MKNQIVPQLKLWEILLILEKKKKAIKDLERY